MRWFIALTVAAFLTFAGWYANAESLDETMWRHMLWISQNSDLPVPLTLPVVEYMSLEMMAIVYYGPEVVATAELQGYVLPTVEAFYNQDTSTMYLPTGYDPAEPMGASTLVHELVHHMQNGVGLLDDVSCPWQVEKLAYELHNKWIDEFNSPEPHSDPMWLLMLEMECYGPRGK